ncbi:DUF2125 domain-containing protein [Aurantimonas sp. VKM B-3413]|uniref:DUF2125 domain-containing protein n=1 Tax=Aurantimonas sp. VKM B-3413 TaxID=2779401 RepID=UPI001E5C3A67|nr:DUF2125 domain-containing protein [Aurantimonas sp. VKM B-3413]MCB8837240.1 DUF2125 domain-containing protein [Aurantimonas sp. VKM B-3413]
MAPSSDSRRRTRRAYLGVVATVVLLAAGLSGAWYYLAGQLDARVTRAIAVARANGTDIECPNREVFGFPFRLGIRCDAVSLDGDGSRMRATAGAFRSAAQIYQPNKVVAELDGPLIVDTADAPPLDLRWGLAQASATFWTQGLDHFAFVANSPVVALAEPAAARQPLVEAASTETHARRRGDDLDLALTVRGAKIVAPGAPSFPSIDTASDLTIGGAADWLTGRARGQSPRQMMSGREVTLRSLLVKAGSASAELSGQFSFGADGRLSGDFKLMVDRPEEIAALIGQAAPQFASIAKTVASAVPFIGRPRGGKTVIDIAARDGMLSAGIVPIGPLPPLR